MLETLKYYLLSNKIFYFNFSTTIIKDTLKILFLIMKNIELGTNINRGN